MLEMIEKVIRDGGNLHIELHYTEEISLSALISRVFGV